MAILFEFKYRSMLRKKVFTVQVVRPWQRLPREAVAALFQETFKVSVDRALRDLS